MTVAISINPYEVYYLPAWVVHPTITGTDDFLFNRKPAEQAGGAKGWRPAQAGRAGILQQHDGIARSAINVCCLRCEAPQPCIFDNDLKYNDKTSNNNGNNDLKWPDNLNDGTEDANHNGRIDGDNGDGVKTFTECWDETSPTLTDSDNDGFRDDLEWENDMDPRTQDSDHDGLLDQEEDVDLDFILDAEETDPSLFDTDGDGLSDKTEIDGWSISIIIEATGEEDTHYTISSDPREVHSDTDTLTDYEEFQNCTDPTKDDTDGDGKDDYEELTYDYGSSPTGIDGTPPTITDFDSSYALRTEVSGPWHDIKITSEYVVKVYISAEDIFGIDWVNVHLEGIDNFIEYCDGEQSIERKKFEFTLDMAQAARSLFKEIKVNITAMDINNNHGYKEDEIPSLSEQLFEGLLGGLNSFAQLVKEIFSTIYNWVLNAGKSIFNNIIEPAYNTIIGYISGIYLAADTYYNNIFNLFTGEEVSFDEIFFSFIDVIVSIFYPFLNIFGSLMDVLMNVVNFYLDFIEYIKDLVKEGLKSLFDMLVINIFKGTECPDFVHEIVFALITEGGSGVLTYALEKLMPLMTNPFIDLFNRKTTEIFNDSESTKAETTDNPSDKGPNWLTKVMLVTLKVLWGFGMTAYQGFKSLSDFNWKLYQQESEYGVKKIHQTSEKLKINWREGLSDKQLKSLWQKNSFMRNILKPFLGSTFSMVSCMIFMWSGSADISQRFHDGLFIFSIVGSLVGLFIEALAKSPWPGYIAPLVCFGVDLLFEGVDVHSV